MVNVEKQQVGVDSTPKARYRINVHTRSKVIGRELTRHFARCGALQFLDRYTTFCNYVPIFSLKRPLAHSPGSGLHLAHAHAITAINWSSSVGSQAEGLSKKPRIPGLSHYYCKGFADKTLAVNRSIMAVVPNAALSQINYLCMAQR